MAQALERERRLYTVLGLEDGASVDEVRKAYKQKALQCHPDKNPNDEEAAELFKLINQAQQVLTDPAKKAHYDSVVLNSETVKFAQRAYRDTHYKDVDEARRHREQELYRKRANRDPSRQGEARRSVNMSDEKREFLQRRDKEREKELASKMARDRDTQRQQELERQRRGETAKQRTEEGRKREGERRARLERTKQLEQDSRFHEDETRRARLESEKLKQEEARKRELERQMVRRQKQLERMKEQRKQEEEDSFYQSLVDARKDIETTEGSHRKLVLAEQAKLRRVLAESGRQGMRSIAQNAELFDLENQEEDERNVIQEEYNFDNECNKECLSEWGNRMTLEDEQIIARGALVRNCVSIAHKLDTCVRNKRALEAEEEALRPAVVFEEQLPHALYDLLFKEVQYRVDLSNSYQTGSQYILTQLHIGKYRITARSRVSAAEVESRAYLCSSEEEGYRMLALEARLLSLTRQEGMSRRQVEIQAQRELDESLALRALRQKKREEEEMRIQRAFDEKLRVEALEREVERLRSDKVSLQHELQISTDCCEDLKIQAQQEAEEHRQQLTELREENRVLREEIKSFNTGGSTHGETLSFEDASSGRSSTFQPRISPTDYEAPPKTEAKSPQSPKGTFTRQRTKSPTTPSTPSHRKRSASNTNASKTTSPSPAGTKRSSVSKVHVRRRSSCHGAPTKSPSGRSSVTATRRTIDHSKSPDRPSREHSFAASCGTPNKTANSVFPSYPRDGASVNRMLMQNDPNARQF